MHVCTCVCVCVKKASHHQHKSLPGSVLATMVAGTTLPCESVTDTAEAESEMGTRTGADRGRDSELKSTIARSPPACDTGQYDTFVKWQNSNLGADDDLPAWVIDNKGTKKRCDAVEEVGCRPSKHVTQQCCTNRDSRAEHRRRQRVGSGNSRSKTFGVVVRDVLEDSRRKVPTTQQAKIEQRQR